MRPSVSPSGGVEDPRPTPSLAVGSEYRGERPASDGGGETVRASFLLPIADYSLFPQHPDIRQVPILVVIVESITDDKRIGDDKPAVVGLERNDLAAHLAEKDGGPDRIAHHGP